MNATQLANRLIESTPEDRERLLQTCESADAVDLARALHGVYQQSNAGDPGRAAAAAACLDLLAGCVENSEVSALAAWTSGMAAVHLDGRMERGVALLGEAAQRF